MNMARACLTYLTFDAFTDGRATSDHDFEERTDRHKLLRYSASYWGHHARQCESAFLRECNGLILKFLRSRNFTVAATQAGNGEGYWSEYSQELAQWLWSYTLVYFGLGEIFTSILTAHLSVHFRDADIDREDESCIMTPLALASREGHEAVVQILLNLRPRRVRLDSGVAFGYPTPLGYAVNNGHRGVVESFTGLRPGAVDLNSSIHCRRHPVITVAAQKGYPDLVGSLIRLGQERVDADTTEDINRRTPLSYAAQNGHHKVVELLISLSPSTVNPDRRDKFEHTPLMLAAANGHADVVQLLMDLGPEQVNANRTNRSGRTALQDAVIKNQLGVVTTLLAYPPDRVDVNISTESFTQTALGCAAEKGLEAMVRAFASICCGRAHFNARGWRNMTSLLWAAKGGYVGIVKLLTDLGPEFVDANLVDVDGHTALIWAVMNEHYETAKFLVQLGEERVNTGILDSRDFIAADYAGRRGRRFSDLFS